MALNGDPLNDAGQNYYAQQFGNRVQNIRKYGATPPSPRNSGCLGTGGAAGGGVFVLFLIIRVVIAVATSGSSSYDNDNSYTAPTYTPPPPIDWNNNVQPDPIPQWKPDGGWQDQPAIPPPDVQPNVPDLPVIVDPNLPVIEDPNPPPPPVPGGDDNRPDKDD